MESSASSPFMRRQARAARAVRRPGAIAVAAASINPSVDVASTAVALWDRYGGVNGLPLTPPSVGRTVLVLPVGGLLHAVIACVSV